MDIFIKYAFTAAEQAALLPETVKSDVIKGEKTEYTFSEDKVYILPCEETNPEALRCQCSSYAKARGAEFHIKSFWEDGTSPFFFFFSYWVNSSIIELLFVGCGEIFKKHSIFLKIVPD